MALVTFKNRPNFVGTLVKLWGNDSDRFWTFSEKITFRCQIGVTGVTLVTDVPKLLHMFIVIISNYWTDLTTGPIYAKKLPCLTPVPFLSHCLIAMRHAQKMALVSFKNRPNFVGTLLKLWGNDSDHFWRFLDIFWENHLPVSKWCHGCHAGHTRSKIAIDTYWCYI